MMCVGSFLFFSNRVYVCGIIRFKLGKTHDDEERTHCRMYVYMYVCTCMLRVYMSLNYFIAEGM